MINQKRLKELLSYDKKTGMFVWIKKSSSRTNNIKVGDIAGTIRKDGYVAIKIDHKSYQAHNLVWLFIYGSMPSKELDHKNHNKADNRFKNLREVKHSVNMQNKSLHKNNKSGVVGVRWNKRDNRWVASITVDKQRKHLGYFIDFSDAVNARKNAEVLYGFHKNHGA